jgi:hypothetical protein
VAHGVGVAAQEAPRPRQADRGRDDGDDRELRAHIEVDGRREDADRAAGETADREGGVEARQDRAPVAALHGDAVRVHRHVERAHGSAVEERQEAQHGQARGERDDAAGQAHGREGHARGAAAADARGAPARHRHGEDRADGRAGEHDAQLAVREADAVADGGDPRGPLAEDEAVEKEDR